MANEKISAMAAIDTTTLDGTEVAPWVQAGGNVSWALASLYKVLAAIGNFLPSNPLDAPAASTLDGYNIVLQGGTGDTDGSGGAVALLGGTAAGVGSGGAVVAQGGAGSGTTGSAGGNYAVAGGNASGGDSDGGNASFRGGTATGTGFAGWVSFTGGSAGDPGGTGGSISIQAGTGTTPGQVLLPGLPTVDPGVSGALYTLAGVLMVSP